LHRVNVLAISPTNCDDLDQFFCYVYEIRILKKCWETTFGWHLYSRGCLQTGGYRYIS